MRRPGHAARALVAVSLVGAWACSLDPNDPAPYVAPPTAAGECGTTDTVLPKMFAFVRADKIAPLRAVMERLTDSRGEISVRTLLEAIVRLLRELGLEHTAKAVQLQSTNRALASLKPLLTTALKLVVGRADGRDRYDAMEATATLIDECPAQDLLTALDGLVRFEVGPPEDRRRWLSVLAKDISPILQDPALQPLLDSFESNAERGKPAIIALLVQILGFLADPEFRIERVETLLESALYPLVSEQMHAQIERTVDRLREIAAPQTNVLPPLQKAIRCMNARPEARAALLGLVFDLVTVDEVDLPGLLRTIEDLTADDDSPELLDFVADVLVTLRDDRVVQTQILGLVEALLRRPDVEDVAPMLLELVEADVGGEVVTALGRLLEGCGR